MSENPQEPTTESTGTQAAPQQPEQQTPVDTQSTEQLGDAGKKALDAMKSERNQARKELADVQKRLTQFEDAQKSAEERAQSAAQAAEKRATEALHRVASAEVRAALTGVVSDPSAIVEDLNLSRFITAEGEVDSEAIGKLREKYAAFTPQQTKSPKPNPAQGSNGSKPHEGQLTHEDMKRMSPEQIVEAQSKGLFDVALGIKK